MAQLSVQETKAHFSEVLRMVAAGETVIVTRHNLPVAEIKPIASVATGIQLGAFEGEFAIPADAFPPMTEAELDDWYGR